jgi:hypothetical protein
MSFCANCTAARYANLKYSRPDWNAFDLRQGLRQACTFYNPAGGGWREDGGYGFPRVPNLTGDSLPPASMVPTNKVALDAAPPLQPTAVGKSGLNGPQVAFRWYNFKQSTFDHTRIRIGKLTMDAGSFDSALNWDVGNLWPLAATNAEFFTVLTNQTTSPPEAYTSVPIPPIIAQPQFNSDAEFQFNIYAFPCNSVSNQFVRVYMSSDLKYWHLLQALCLPDGKAAFKDSAITNANCRFYRLVQGNLHSQSLGFTRVRVAPGKAAIIANQLDHCNNTISNLFGSSVIPGPVSLAKDNATNSSSYNPTNQTWSNPTLPLSLGEAAWFTNSATQDCIIRFVGDVNEGVTSTALRSDKAIVGLMIPIQFSDYVIYEFGLLGPDPLGPGSTLRRWDGAGFVNYTNGVFGWTPQMPPVQPGEGFSIQPGFSIPTNQPTEWGMAFSGIQQVPYTSGLQITQIQIQGSDVVLAFTSNPGGLYILEFSDDDTFSTWTQGPDIVGGTGDIVLTVHLKGATNNKRFYRIRQLPPNP